MLVSEVLEFLAPRAGGVYVDCTVGMGGHTKAILRAAASSIRMICIDKDPAALALAEQNLAQHRDMVSFVGADFRTLEKILDEQGIGQADGVLFDFGVSSLQFDAAERGFSYQQNAPLDMRMDLSNPLTAALLVNTEPPEELTRILREYGEERWASRIAAFIVAQRARHLIETTDDLVAVIKAAIPAGARRRGPHPARRTFQALRIAVNDELGAIEQGLKAALTRLAPGGTLCAISFHSLEDRITKNMFREAAQIRSMDRLTKKPVVPSAEEIERNPRSRSAKLRAIRRVL